MKYGTTTNSVKNNKSVLSPEDLSRHVYILAGSGSGKSSFIRTLYKHLEHANLNGTFPNASIYIDVKDEDAKQFLRQCDQKTIRNNNVTYLDINHTDFAINLLELPSHNQENRDAVVSRMVGHIIEMFKEFYSQQQTFVQMERILRLLLFYLYSNIDSPTMLDLYEIIVRLQTDGKSELQRIFEIYKNVTGPEMQTALNSIASLSKDAWVPLLNRIEMFATDVYLKRKFSVKHTTIDFEKMLSPGNITIFRISDTETPRYAHSLAIMAIIIKIWFAIQERASKTEQDKRSLVVLTLDEFQKIKDLTVLTSILSQARAYNLGLILSHQNTAQIQIELLETITGNTATQIYGRVSGVDAFKVSKIMDPHFAKELTDQITVQSDFVFTAKMRAPLGEEQTTPIRFRSAMPPKLTLSEDDTAKFIVKMREMYGVHQENFESSMQSEEADKTKWMNQLGLKYLERRQWNILNAFYENSEPLSLMGIMRICKFLDHRDIISGILQEMKNNGLVEITDKIKRGTVTITKFKISEKTRIDYFDIDYSQIGTAKDIPHVTQEAMNHYRKLGYFVAVANQNVQKGKYRTDLVAYNYEEKSAISVEIESHNEVVSHFNHVLLNMTKWKELGFSECHVWSKNKKIKEIKEMIEEKDIKEKVKTFVIQQE